MLKQRKWPVKVTPLSELTEEEVDREYDSIIKKIQSDTEEYSHEEFVRKIESGELRLMNWDGDISFSEYVRQVKEGTYGKNLSS